MDTIYRVILSLETTGSLATKLGEVESRASAVSGSLERVRGGAIHVERAFVQMGHAAGDAIQRVADKAAHLAATVLKLGAGLVVGGAAYGVGGLNNELEQTKFSLASIFQSQGYFKNFDMAFLVAGNQLQKMRQDIKSLPGDLGQLADIMRTIATPAAQSGAHIDDIRKLAGRTMLAAGIMNVPKDAAAREMAALLSGHATVHNTLGLRLGFVGEAAKQLNKEAPDKRLRDITAALDGFQGVSQRYGATFAAQWTTFTSSMKYDVLARVTQPLFEHVLGSLSRVNEYLSTHEEQVERLSSAVGDRLAHAWDRIEGVVMRVGPMVERMIDRVSHMSGKEMLAKGEHVGEAILGTKALGMGVSGGASVLGTLLRSGLLAGGGGEAAGAAGGIGLGGGLAVTGVAAAAIVGDTAIVAGAIDNLTNASSRYHASTVKSVSQMHNAMDVMSAAAMPLVDAGLGLARTGMDALGDAAASFLAPKLQMAAEAVRFFAGELIWIREIAKWSNTPLGKYKSPWDIFNASKDEIGPLKEHDIGLMNRAQGAADAVAAAARAKGPAAGGGGGTHIQEVKIVVSGNDDPSRVARLTLEKFKEFARNPTASKFTPQYANR